MKTSYIIKSLFLGLTLTGMAACSGDVDKADYDKAIVTPAVLPTVTTGDVVVSGVAAKATIDLQIPEGVEVSREGFILSTDPAAPLADASNKFYDFNKVKSGEQIAAITGLTAGTTYYIKAYAYVEGAMTYGETKTIVATDDYERTTTIDIDFTDANALAAAPFSAVKLGESRQDFEIEPLDELGFRGYYGFVNTVLHHTGLFQQGQAAFGSNMDEGLLTYELNLTNVNFPEITIQGFNIAAIFGNNYPTNAGNFDVYASAAPITTAEELAEAEKIGSCKFSTDPTDQTFELNQVTCTVPASYTGKVYITIYNKSVRTATLVNGNLGVAIVGFTVTSLQKKAAETPAN